MGRYDSHKNPLARQLVGFAQKRITENLEQLAKSIPASIKQIEKDFVHVNFDTKNSIFTPPVMKMTQSFSRFGREPTQGKDMGLAVPGGYYLGGNTAFSGGQASYYPRGNLSTLTWQPMANLNAPKRDYDQHWETGGPNGWRCKVQESQQEKKGSGQFGSGGGASGGNGGGSSPAVARLHEQIMRQRYPTVFGRGGPAPYAINGSSSSNGGGGGQQQQQQQQQDYTEFSFDKDGQIISQSKDRKHYLKIAQKDKKVMLTGEGDSTVFGKKNAFLNSGGGMCIVNPSGEGEESGAGWDGGKGQGQQSSSGGGGLGGIGGASVKAVPDLTREKARATIMPRGRIMRGEPEVTPFDGGGGGGGGGGGKVYLGGDPKKDKFCLVQTVCGPSKNVYAKI
jgi:hypothetical protein